MNSFLTVVWFLIGFLSWVWFTYKMRVGPYHAGDVFVSLLFSFTGPPMLLFILAMLAHEKLSKITFTKE